MIKVEITSGYCNPPLTYVVCCDTIRYFEAKGKLSMYNEKGQLIKYCYIYDWKEVSYTDGDGNKHFIKRG